MLLSIPGLSSGSDACLWVAGRCWEVLVAECPLSSLWPVLALWVPCIEGKVPGLPVLHPFLGTHRGAGAQSPCVQH